MNQEPPESAGAAVRAWRHTLPNRKNIEPDAEGEDDKSDSGKYFCLSSCPFLSLFTLLNPRAPEFLINCRVIVSWVIHFACALVELIVAGYRAGTRQSAPTWSVAGRRGGFLCFAACSRAAAQLA